MFRHPSSRQRFQKVGLSAFTGFFTLFVVWAGLCRQTLRAQHGALTREAAVEAALQRHASLKAASFNVQSKKQAEKAAPQFSNPELNVESPIGEFYALGIMQRFESPAVYARRKQLAGATTLLAQKELVLTENEVRRSVRLLFLQAQAAGAEYAFWTQRDSVYQRIAATARRQFAGGEIDFVQQTLAEQEADNVRQERRVAEKTANSLKEQLALYTGLPAASALEPLYADTTLSAFAALPAAQSNPVVLYEQQAAEVAKSQMALAKSRALPDFAIGYLNQGPLNTPLLYRFRAGLGIPLWVGQYRAGVRSARMEGAAAAARAEAQMQITAREVQNARNAAENAASNLHYYQRTALPRSQTLIAAALRLREAGQTDYTTFLRTLADAYAVQRHYITQLSALEEARIALLYLTGQ